ncbi:putative amidohydrolase [Bernardetia litoralis DSM 6794]|uniref:Putative amidohydrolase n=1 Tax=Bernardetia litoralis (strain ATCC 23117 / DSM 6794 / NBRC 15988 / NCIMB 1366 / Fx l1 / Sio-4) TaxID=880071 RepID=I4AF42_BERLS|nr:carbon-nitrogen hydrolase [Bernardetia litoralis]AFM02577.1 putative amidohydrolase [Bernardetia litoralis DSM 6794]
MKNLKVGLVQQTCSTNREENIKKSQEGIRECAKNGANLVVLQELHNNVYFCQSEDVNYFDLAETIPGYTSNAIAETAKECGVVVVASIFERRAAGIYHNTAVVLESDGTIAGTYRKMHIPDDPAYYEKFYFTPGDYEKRGSEEKGAGFEPINTSIGRLGVLVCWDQWYPEAARLMALAGAEVLIYPTAIGWEKGDTQDEKDRQRNAWIISQRGHAVANGLPVISVNRTGFEEDSTGVTDGITFWGNSFVTGSQGEFLFEGSKDKEENNVVEIDMKRSENVRRIWPFLRDRRIDAYSELLKRYRS